MKTNRSPLEKIYPRKTLIETFGRPREGKLVFTNGCFDILHRGHVEYLHQARALGDLLVVGVNTDASVERLKGLGRPVVGQDDRVMILAGLESVDAVTLFEEDTPLALISSLLPDVLVKGGDYTADEMIGREEVEAAGGEARIIPFIHGRSTTEVIQLIRGENP
jgi:D-beta-D-heptose 7-phosphate kinase/D-beta-D-heptose 1-phosphate adenosyltransferase